MISAKRASQSVKAHGFGMDGLFESNKKFLEANKFLLESNKKSFESNDERAEPGKYSEPFRPGEDEENRGGCQSKHQANGRFPSFFVIRFHINRKSLTFAQILQAKS